jgi:transposase
MTHVSKFDRTRVVTLFQTELTCDQISTHLGIPQSIISFIILRWRRTGTVARAQGSVCGTWRGPIW